MDGRRIRFFAIMPLFHYRATEGRDAEDVRGTISADTPRQARDLLRERGLVVREMNESAVSRQSLRPTAPGIGRLWAAKTSASDAADDADPSQVDSTQQLGSATPATERRPRLRWSRRMRPQVTGFVRELATLIDVGVPLHEALETLATQATGPFRQVVLVLRERVAAGSGMANAMREQPGVFDELACSLVAVGEEAGSLELSLDRLAEFRERSDQLRGRVGTALLYPAIVLSMAVFAALFLMTFVVPRILEPLIEQGLELPWPTRVVRAASDGLLQWGWLIAIGLVGLGISAATLVRTPRGRYWWDRTLLRLPVFGPLMRKQGVVRMAVVLSTLLRGGVQFLPALQVARRTVGNRVMAEAISRCERAVAAGGDIAQALTATGAFPQTVVQVFAVGQQAGRLEEVLDRLAAAYDRQVASGSARLAAVLEPALIVILAGLVLFIILATVLPILEAGNAIG